MKGFGGIAMLNIGQLKADSFSDIAGKYIYYKPLKDFVHSNEL